MSFNLRNVIWIAIWVFSQGPFAFSGPRTCQEVMALIANRDHIHQPTDTLLEWPKSITSRSPELARTVELELLPLYRRAHHGAFITRDNVRLPYSFFKASPESLINGKPRATLVLAHGLGESRPQWLDQIKTFTREGYDVFIYEHRGQAHADRSLPNPNKVHVNRFEDYEHDMHEFINRVVKEKSEGPFYGVGFSMGGLITTFNGIHHPEDLSALVTISPAYQIKTRQFPVSIVKGLVDFMVWMGKEKEYSFYQKDFSEDKLELLRQHTHSADRWQAFLKVLEMYPMTVPGSLTHGWLSQMLAANQKIQKEIPNLNKPTLVIEAGQDGLVNPAVVNKLAVQHPWITHYVEPKSLHSIIHEVDSIRNSAFTEILRYLVHPERLDDPKSPHSWESLLAQSENFLSRGEQAFSKYAAEEALRKWKATNPSEAAPEKLTQTLKKVDQALNQSQEGQQGLYQFLNFRRQEELKKLYP
ncbi:MAG: alpha/beta hydrolase [Proteobacteria bacterium]|nr:alpha/beta hydrolase [Pseudomonadota bacterium]